MTCRRMVPADDRQAHTDIGCELFRTTRGRDPHVLEVTPRHGQETLSPQVTRSNRPKRPDQRQESGFGGVGTGGPRTQDPSMKLVTPSMTIESGNGWSGRPPSVRSQNTVVATR